MHPCPSLYCQVHFTNNLTLSSTAETSSRNQHPRPSQPNLPTGKYSLTQNLFPSHPTHSPVPIPCYDHPAPPASSNTSPNTLHTRPPLSPPPHASPPPNTTSPSPQALQKQQLTNLTSPSLTPFFHPTPSHRLASTSTSAPPQRQPPHHQHQHHHTLPLIHHPNLQQSETPNPSRTVATSPKYRASHCRHRRRHPEDRASFGPRVQDT